MHPFPDPGLVPIFQSKIVRFKKPLQGVPASCGSMGEIKTALLKTAQTEIINRKSSCMDCKMALKLTKKKDFNEENTNSFFI